MTRAPRFEDVITAHGAMIQRIAAAHEADANLREDLVQTILFALWRALPGFRGEAPLQAFVARVAANRAVTHVQRAVRDRARPHLPGDPVDGAPNPEDQAILASEKEHLLAAVQALPLSLREPALLAMEGLTAREIAAVLGLSANAVSVRMTRAKAILRQSMGGDHGKS